jgi:16S rRNA (cytidine1402-2'-O)-methyltransferase
MIYLVGVPIGNYDDMTFRALETLKKVDVIAAEDTRKAKRLLQHFLITDKDVLSHGSHNEHSSVNGLIALVQQGKSIAYISDAGMPGISDPGYMLIRAAIQAGIETDVIPGVTAAVTAVAISGIPCDRFAFQGFIPRKVGDRTKWLERIKAYPETLIFYEAPHRVVEMMEALVEFFPNRACAIGRELTKIHQEFIRGSVSDLAGILKNRSEILGEFTIVVQGASEEETKASVDVDAEIKTRVDEGMKPKAICSELADKFGLKKKEVYNRILEMTGKM